MEPKQQGKEPRNPIYSLISMLDEPDPLIYEKISDSITGLGSGAIPVLEDVAENTFDPKILDRLEDLVRTIHAEGIRNDLQRWKVSENHDLIQFLQILSKYHFRKLDMVQLNDRIAAMQKEIWLELNENLTSLECVRLVNHFILRTWNFAPDNSNLLDADVFFLNTVLQHKKAHPATLGAFYLGFCQRLTLPVFYVGLPENFILAYTSQPFFKPRFKPGEILFYINPLLDGVIFNKLEIESFLKNHEIPSQPQFFEVADNLRVGALILREMQKIYHGSGEQYRVSDVQRMIGILESRKDIDD
jgi:hypothetical protein